MNSFPSLWCSGPIPLNSNKRHRERSQDAIDHCSLHSFVFINNRGTRNRTGSSVLGTPEIACLIIIITRISNLVAELVLRVQSLRPGQVPDLRAHLLHGTASFGASLLGPPRSFAFLRASWRASSSPFFFLGPPCLLGGSR